MQQKQMTQHTMTQQKMTQQKMTPQKMTVQKMSVATPQNDTRHFMIPKGTIVQDEKKSFRLPFRFLRTWIFSLLAIIALPIGLGLALVGQSISESTGRPWRETTATVISADESSRTFSWESDGKEYDETVSFDPFSYVVGNDDGIVSLTYDLCDLVGVVAVPANTNETFPVWVNPANIRDVSCVPMDNDTGAIILTIGWILIGLSVWRLLGAINADATRPVNNPR